MRNHTPRATTWAELHSQLAARPRPEAVASQLLFLMDSQLSPNLRQLLARSARYRSYSYMPDQFRPVVGLEQSARALASLIDLPIPSAAQASDPSYIRGLVSQGRRFLGMHPGLNDFRGDRLNRAARKVAGMELSRRRYNKLFRLITRLEELNVSLERQVNLFNLGRFAKTALAADLAYEQFASDPRSAAFVAYYTANLARRSLFLAGPQARAFDEVAAELFAHCEAGESTNWFVIAHVFPRADVLSHLSSDQCAELLNRALDVLRLAASGLEEQSLKLEVNYERMTVQTGNDSSTWNELAGAWNRARDYWIAIAAELGGEQLFEAFLPGKAMRLMAADVVFMHSSYGGGDVHPDTGVFAALPKPWDVMAGREACGRELVESTCHRLGVDPLLSGWTAPRVRSAVSSWQPTPESVHGVVVNHPELSHFFRKIGVFGGQAKWRQKMSARAALETHVGMGEICVGERCAEHPAGV